MNHLFVFLNADTKWIASRMFLFSVSTSSPLSVLCSKFKHYMCRIPICLCLLFCATGFTQNDGWIDKHEDENYSARHECSFVQAGVTFVMFGGREDAQTLDVYNFKKNTWQKGGKAPKPFNHFQALFYEGFIWVIGSFETNTFPKEIPATHVWLYYPPTKSWIKGPEIPENRRRGGAGLAIYNDLFYLVGGNTKGHDGGYVDWFDLYDPIANTWTILDHAPHARDHFSLMAYNNKLYTLGGRQSGGFGGVFQPLIAPVDVYDLKEKSWTTETQLPTPRAAPAVALFNDELFVIGGEGTKKGPAYRIVEAYNPKTKQWSPKAKMTYPRHGTQAITSGRGIYITGGSPKRGGGRQLHMEVYNKDKPHGQPIALTKLQLPRRITFKRNTTRTILLKPKKGNTGCFISSIVLKGKDKNAFKLKTPHHLTLLKHGTSYPLTLQHNGTNTLAEVELEITYNGNLTTSSKLLLD